MRTTTAKERDRLRHREYRARNPLKVKEAAKRWHENNKEQHKANSKAWYAANKDKVRNYFLIKTFGVTLEDYTKIFIAQGEVCAICGDTSTADGTNTNKNWPIDHSHKTGAIRGILCRGCNVGIGHLKEDPTLINKAINYLKKFSRSE